MTRNCLITESRNVILVRVRTDQVTGTRTAAMLKIKEVIEPRRRAATQQR